MTSYQKQAQASYDVAKKEYDNAVELIKAREARLEKGDYKLKIYYDQTSGKIIHDTPEKQEKRDREALLRDMKILPAYEKDMDRWKDLVDKFSEKIQQRIKEDGDEAEKEYNERMKWLEDLKKGYQELGKLETQRKELFQSIQDSYIQQGVDILSTMGKSGKYMSQMEMSSMSQNRFSPITTRMDKMDKQLEHLSKIDTKIDKMKTGLL